MSLFKRKKKGKDGQLYELGPWQYLFWIDGKRFKGSTHTEDKKQAVKVEARERVAAENGESRVKKKTVTVRDMIAGFEEWVKTINKAPKTIADYRNGCRLILASNLAGMRADQVTVDDTEAAAFNIGTKEEPLYSPYSTNCALRTLRRAYRWAVRKKKIRALAEWLGQGHPGIKLMDAPRRELMVSDDDENRLLAAIATAAADRRYKKRPASPLGDVFTTMLDAGMRDGEVVRMEIENINWKAADYFNPKGKTKRARRHVPLSERVLALLRTRCGDRKSGWVFPSSKAPSGHVELRGLQKHFRQIAESLGLPGELKLYCSRHTFGTVAMAETRDPGLVSETMGHKDLKTTLQYLHPDVTRIKAVIDKRNESKLVH